MVSRAAGGARGPDPPRRAAPRDARILEIGCGTGHNLPMLGDIRPCRCARTRRRGARRSRRSGSAATIMSAPLPELAGVPDRHYDLIGAFDVIEHIDDDRAAHRFDRDEAEARRQVHHDRPAHPWMWTAHDVVNHHKRRYSKRALQAADRGLAAAAGRDRLFQQPAVPAAVAERLASKCAGEGGQSTSRFRLRRSTQRWSEPSPQNAIWLAACLCRPASRSTQSRQCSR